MSDRRWARWEDARERLLVTFATSGVSRTEYIAAFPALDSVGVCLCTLTDEQRDALGRVNPGLSSVREVLADAGFADDELVGLSTTAQSQETVERDFEGSWFCAMR